MRSSVGILAAVLAVSMITLSLGTAYAADVRLESAEITAPNTIVLKFNGTVQATLSSFSGLLLTDNATLDAGGDLVTGSGNNSAAGLQSITGDLRNTDDTAIGKTLTLEYQANSTNLSPYVYGIITIHNNTSPNTIKVGSGLGSVCADSENCDREDLVGLPIKAAQAPTLEKVSIEDDNIVKLEFSEDVDTPTNGLYRLNAGASGTIRDYPIITSTVKADGNIVTMQYRGTIPETITPTTNALPSNTQPAISFFQVPKDITDKQGNKLGSNTTSHGVIGAEAFDYYGVTDNRKPSLLSFAFTSGDTITAKFSEDVVAEGLAFNNGTNISEDHIFTTAALPLGSETYQLTLGKPTGNNTDTIKMTYKFTFVNDDNERVEVVDIPTHLAITTNIGFDESKVRDLVGNPTKPVTIQNIDDGQAPKFVSAEIVQIITGDVAESKILLTHSEPIDEVDSENFSNIRIGGVSQSIATDGVVHGSNSMSIRDVSISDAFNTQTHANQTIITLASDTYINETDATGTIDIGALSASSVNNILTTSDENEIKIVSTIDAQRNISLTDGQDPIIESAKITDSDTVVIKFSEPVRAITSAVDLKNPKSDSLEGENYFVNFTIGDGVPTSEYVKKMSSDRTTMTITLEKESQIADDTGTIKLINGTDGDIDADADDLRFIVDDENNTLKLNYDTSDTRSTEVKHDDDDKIATGAAPAFNIEAGQRPDITSAMITGPNEITIEFTEAVLPTTSHFTNLVIFVDGTLGNANDLPSERFSSIYPTDDTAGDVDDLKLTTSRNIISMGGSGTSTITLTFDGDAAPSNAEAVVTIGSTLPDTSDTEFGSRNAAVDDTTGNTNPLFFDSDTADPNNPTILKIKDGQRIYAESAKITASDDDRNTIIVTFSEAPSSVVTKNAFENLSIIGESTTREVISANSDGINATIIFGGPPVKTDATATIDITNAIKSGEQNIVPISGFSVADGLAPLLMSADIISSNIIHLEFSEKVKVDTAEKAFDNLMITNIKNDPEDRTITSIPYNDAKIIRLHFSGASINTNATGTLDVTNELKDAVGNPFVPIASGNNVTKTDGSFDLKDDQPPVILSGAITDGNEITITFSEMVTVASNGVDFTNLLINGDSRTISRVTSNDLGVVTLTFSGAPVASDAIATINVADTIIDMAKNSLESLTGYEIAAGQIPMVESATLIEPDTIEIVFSESVDAQTEDFTNLVLIPGGARNIASCSTDRLGANECRDTASSTTFYINFTGTPATTTATATIDISGDIKDVAGVTLANALNGYHVMAGQIPTITHAQFSEITSGGETNTIRVEFSEPVNATKDSFTNLELLDGHRNIGTCMMVDPIGDEEDLAGLDSVYHPAAMTSITDNPECDGVIDIDGADGTVADATTTTSLSINLRAEEFTITFTGQPAVANTTATLDIGVSTPFYDKHNNAFEAITSQPVAASQPPMLLSTAITGSNQITMTFSEPVIAEMQHFGNLMVNNGDTISQRAIIDIAGSRTDTLTLTFGGEPAMSGATATINVEGLTDLAGTSITPLRASQVQDKQPPTLLTAGITGTNQITLVFSEPVTSQAQHFGNLMITGETSTRAISSVVSSTPTTHILTFGGTPTTSDATATIDITAGLTDTATNPINPVANVPITDMQAPMATAAITGTNQITIEFTEAITASQPNFTHLIITGETTPRPILVVDPSTTTTRILIFGGAPTTSDATATMDISLVPDLASNILNTTIVVTDKQLPTLTSAALTMPNQLTVTFSENVMAIPSHFANLAISSSSDIRTITDVTGQNTASLVLTFDGAPTTTDATATIDITAGLTDTATNPINPVANVMVTDMQPPIMISADITSSNQVTIVFSEPVTTQAQHFENLMITGETSTRAISSVVSSTPTTHILTFGGAPTTTDATGTIDISGLSDIGSSDRDSILIVPIIGATVTDKQPPRITSAAITDLNQITLVFSETVTTSPSSFSDLQIMMDGTTTSRQVTMINNNPTTTAVTAKVFTLTFGGTPLSSAAATATVDIFAVADTANNNIVPVQNMQISTGTLTPAMVSGTVFADNAPENQIQDNNEPGIPQVPVTMIDYTTGISYTTTTDANGMYEFTDTVSDSSVLVQITVPANHVPSAGTVSYAYKTIAVNTDTTADFPLFPITDATYATISGTVFEDTNNNSSYDAGIDNGFVNLVVFAIDYLTLTQLTASTDANGFYTIQNVLPDAVYVQLQSLPLGYNFAQATTWLEQISLWALHPTLDRGATHTIDFVLNQVASNDKATITATVFDDANSNGQRDQGELPVQGAVVFTYEFLSAAAQNLVTDAQGQITFTGLTPGQVLVQINNDPYYFDRLGFNTITTSNAGAEYLVLPTGGSESVEFGLGSALTAQEREYLDSKESINVGFDSNWEPFEYADNNGMIAGLSAFYVEKYEAFTGLDFISVEQSSWTDTLTDLRDGNVDIITMIADTQERRDMYNIDFTNSYTTIPVDMITATQNQATTTVDDLSTLNVATVRGYAVESWLDTNMPSVSYTSYDTPAAALAALSSGVEDVYLESWPVASLVASENNIDGLASAGSVGYVYELAVAVQDDDAILKSIMQKAIDSIPESERAAEQARVANLLTAQEREYLDSKESINVGFDSNWEPFEYADNNGMIAGLSAFYVEKYEAFTGLDFISVEQSSWTDTLTDLRDGNVDIITMIADTQERRDMYNIDFTNSYTTIPVDMITATQNQATTTVDDLSTLNVATVRGYAVESWLDTNMPSVSYTSYDTPAAALAALSSGVEDVYLESWPVASLVASENNIDGLASAGSVGYVYELAVAVQDDDAILKSIMQKAIDSIPESERAAEQARVANAALQQ